PRLTSTLFPYTTLFRSVNFCSDCERKPPTLRLPHETHPSSRVCREQRQRRRTGAGARTRHDCAARGREGQADRTRHAAPWLAQRSEEHTSELQSPCNLV